MPCKIQNKMYIVSGAVKGDDLLRYYRFQTMQGLGKVHWSYTHRLFDIALEVNMTGKNIEFDKYDSDSYWTCSEEIKLSDLDVKRVAFIDGKWRALDIDPYEDDADDYLREQGYERKIGYGGGWFSKDKEPPFDIVIYQGFKDCERLQLKYDAKTDQYAGMIPNMRKKQITIHASDQNHWWKSEIGNLKVEGDEVVIHLHDDVYRFRKETDPDFIKWAKLCNKSYNQLYLKEEREDKKNKDKPESYYEELSRWLDSLTEKELENSQYCFARCLKRTV